MNPVVNNFPQILEFARQHGLPVAKKRAILREYLQVKILDILYQEKMSLKLYFVGGTSLRLLHGLDRFSEDLDFDTDHLSNTAVPKLLQRLRQKLQNENIAV